MNAREPRAVPFGRACPAEWTANGKPIETTPSRRTADFEMPARDARSRLVTPPGRLRKLHWIFALLLLTCVGAATAWAGSAAINCGAPAQGGTVVVRIWIGKDDAGRHGTGFKSKPITINAGDTAAQKARKIARAIRREAERNGATVSVVGNRVVVTNDKRAWPVDFVKVSDSTGEADDVSRTFEGNPEAPPEALVSVGSVRLEGVPEGGLATFGEDGHIVTVPTEGLTIEQIYQVWQDELGGEVIDGELVLEPHTYTSDLPDERSYHYEVVDPGLTVIAGQETLFDWRDTITGGLRLTTTDQGTLGFLSDSDPVGTGLVYPAEEGTNHLFIGGLWLGLGPEEVLNRDYDADPSPDWVPAPRGTVRGEDEGSLGQSLRSQFIGANSNGVDVFIDFSATSYDFGDADDDFVIARVRHDNRGPQVLEGAYSGLFLDLDLGGSGLDDVGSVDEGSGAIYMTNSDGTGPYIGLAVAPQGPDCTDDSGVRLTFIPNGIYIHPEDHIADPDKWGFLSGSAPEYTLSDAPSPEDYSMLASIGPFDLLPGESRESTFILAAGMTLEDMLVNLETAREVLCTGVPAGVEEGSAHAFPSSSLLRAWPNPTTGPVHLEYRTGADGLPSAKVGSLDLFDAGGRLIRRLAPSDGTADVGALVWDGRDAHGRSVPSGTYFARFQAGGVEGTTRILVVR